MRIERAGNPDTRTQKKTPSWVPRIQA
jgi:hypothetical protein